MRTLTPIFALGLSAGLCLGQEATVTTEWLFDKDGDLEGWQPSAHIADAQVKDGVLSGRAVDWDPILMAPPVDFEAGPWQTIEIHMSHTTGGDGQVFFTNTLDSPYGGFLPEKQLTFGISGDGEMHTYVLRPFWQAEKRIIRLRLDVPNTGAFAIDSIRVLSPVEAVTPAAPDFDFTRGDCGWSADAADASADGAWVLTPRQVGAMAMSPRMEFSAAEAPIIAVRMVVDAGRVGILHFATTDANGLQAAPFALVPDGRPHTYNIEACGNSAYKGTIIALALEPTDEVGSRARLESIRAADTPQGPPDLAARSCGLVDVVNRAGMPSVFEATVVNRGGETARAARVRLSLPDGVRADSPLEQELPDVDYGFPTKARWTLTADRPVSDKAEVTLVTADGDLPASTVDLAFSQAPQVPKMDHVPEPVKPPTKYQVGVYYFPGWWDRNRWAPIEDFPERKPILGWYDEGRPEIADWQISWAVDHGISFFVVDWYWSAGARSLEHWLHNAYEKSRYRDKLDFCLLWANHNPAGSSSLEDCLAVTQYWIDNYFKRDEYVKVDGKPVMVIFSTYRLREDLGSEGVRKAFDAMDELCRQNGIPGIYMVACALSGKSEIQLLADEGYDAISGYNYPGLNSDGKLWAPYETCIEGYRDLWREAESHGILKEIPVLSGGWDSRPWHGDRSLVRYGRTPELFEKHLRDAKAFLDNDGKIAPDLNMCIIEAWNEWGEGSYIEPHREFGFGYLDAIRRVFCDAPEKHEDLTPKDVGLGPYDLPEPEERTAWDFGNGEAQGWGVLMGLSDFAVRDGALRARSATNDPAFSSPALAVSAQRYGVVEITMSSTRDDQAQLFWSTSTAGESEGRSVHFDVVGDGQMHTYRIDLRAQAAWRGRVTHLRLDPCNTAGVDVAIEAVRLLGAV